MKVTHSKCLHGGRQVDKDLVIAEAVVDLHDLACRREDGEDLSHGVISLLF
jgi:hypothetical protein